MTAINWSEEINHDRRRFSRSAERAFVADELVAPSSRPALPPIKPETNRPLSEARHAPSLLRASIKSEII